MRKLLLSCLLICTLATIGDAQTITRKRSFAPFITLGRTTPSTTTDTLYNPTGVLTYNGTAVALTSSNVATATKLVTARAINSVNFDGSAAVQVPTGTGTTAAAAGPVALNTTTHNSQTFKDTAGVTFTLPTGDLSAFISAAVTPLTYRIAHFNAGTTTIDPGAGNFIAGGGAAKTMTNSVAAETYATVTLQLIDSTGSVNKWVITGGHGTWAMTP